MVGRVGSNQRIGPAGSNDGTVVPECLKSFRTISISGAHPVKGGAQGHHRHGKISVTQRIPQTFREGIPVVGIVLRFILRHTPDSGKLHLQPAQGLQNGPEINGFPRSKHYRRPEGSVGGQPTPGCCPGRHLFLLPAQ